MLELDQPEGTTPGPEYGVEKCGNCGQPYLKKRVWQLFCSTECRMKCHQLEREIAVREYRLMKKSRGV